LKCRDATEKFDEVQNDTKAVIMVRKRWMRWRGGRRGEEYQQKRRRGGGEGDWAVQQRAKLTQLHYHSFSGTRILSRQLGTQTELRRFKDMMV
jgi:hypothetical protein